jgi:hypothetical protein
VDSVWKNPVDAGDGSAAPELRDSSSAPYLSISSGKVSAIFVHECVCGTSSLVAWSPDGRDDLEWLALARRVARGTGRVLVGPGTCGFVCPGCKRLHLRGQPPVLPVPRELADGHDAVPLVMSLS